jgi:hypothetical protein
VALSAKATQEFVPIKEVREGTVVLKDGGLRAIIAVSSVNLSLKSSDEQIATISQFQSFLNSIDFPIQIVIQSRRLDVRPYLLTLEEKMKVQREPLLKIQTAGYISFIREFTDAVSIMRKYFYVVVPYEEAALTTKSGSSFLGGIFKGKRSAKERRSEEDASFEEKRTQLDERVSVISGGLESCGARTERLQSEEVIELFYRTFNPGDLQPAVKLMEATGQN